MSEEKQVVPEVKEEKSVESPIVTGTFNKSTQKASEGDAPPTKQQADVKIIVKQPKVKKVETEKKPRTEAQIKAMEKMREGLDKKRQERNDAKKAALDAEKKEREDAVKRAEEEAKKITPNVQVQQVRGRKPGTKNPPKLQQIVPEPVQQRQMTHSEYMVMKLREKGIHIPDNATPYMIKMIMSRYR